MSNTSLIGTAKAARLLEVDRSTLTRWVKAGKVTPAIVVPGYKGPLLFDPTDLPQSAESGDHDDTA